MSALASRVMLKVFMTAVQYCRYKRRDFKWWLYVQLCDCGIDEVALQVSFTSAACRPMHSFMVERYGSLRGSSRGCYGPCIGTPSLWGHNVVVREGYVKQKQKKCVCAGVFMPEWMRLWLWNSGVVGKALFPSPERWTSEDKCVCVGVYAHVCSYSEAKAFYPDRCLCLTCLSVMLSSWDSCCIFT